MSENGRGRTRSWTFIIYPESAPSNWREVLDQEFIQWVESPLHDKDLNVTGEVKKAHIHILLMFESVKSFEQVKELTDKLNCPIPQKCHGAKGLVRYMAHLDNPEKYQYNISDIISHGGADLSELLKPSASEKYQIIKEMILFIKENHISEYQDLVDYSISFKYDTWFSILCENSLIIMNYIKSVRYRTSQKIDYLSGELRNNKK